MLSLPSRECGLKLFFRLRHICPGHVTPLAGVWIEMQDDLLSASVMLVTPLAGVWIEIIHTVHHLHPDGSHSPRGSVD